jgi:hypothetical protein
MNKPMEAPSYIEMPPVTPLARLPICDGLYIEYDTADTWFAICDEDWMSYDQSGAVIMNISLLDILIEKLQLMKQADPGDWAAANAIARPG